MKRKFNTKLLSAVTALAVAFGMLSAVSAQIAPEAHFETPLESYLTMGFNEAGDKLEFRAAKGGIPAQTAIAFATDRGKAEHKVSCFGDVRIVFDALGGIGFGNGFVSGVAYNEQEGLLAGAVAVSSFVPEGTPIFRLSVVGTGRISITGDVLVSNASGDSAATFNVSVSNEPTCGDCGICESGKPATLGDITGTGDVTTSDALEILKNIVAIDNVVDDCESARTAALITKGSMESANTSTADGLEILKYIVDLPNAINANR